MTILINGSAASSLPRRLSAVLLLTLFQSFYRPNPFSVGVSAMTTTEPATPNLKIIDSHLHVWADSTQAENGYPYVQVPPDNLKDKASTKELLQQMKTAGVAGALIVQPINHQYDHSYVLQQAMQQHPETFKGMLLHDPSLSATDAVAKLEELALQGFVGVRFNPYLWPQNEHGQHNAMAQGAGLAVYQRCAEMHMPVGIMCFQGLDLHYEDILQLLKQSPETTMILDHFSFTSTLANERANSNFEKLLSLAEYPQVHVKISALFRLDDTDQQTFEAVRTKRFQPLLQAFGANRLLYGSDFPYVLEQTAAGGYAGMAKLVASWMDNDQDRNAVMGGTTEQLFGPWGYNAIGGSGKDNGNEMIEEEVTTTTTTTTSS